MQYKCYLDICLGLLFLYFFFYNLSGRSYWVFCFYFYFYNLCLESIYQLKGLYSTNAIWTLFWVFCFSFCFCFLQIVLKLFKGGSSAVQMLSGWTFNFFSFIFFPLINYCVYKLIGGIYVSTQMYLQSK